MNSTHLARRWPALAAMLAVAALALLSAATPSPGDTLAPTRADRFVTTQPPASPAGRQLAWFIDASRRLPIDDAQLRAHFSPAFLASPGASPAEVNELLRTLIDETGAKLLGLTIAEPDRVVAIVIGRDARELTLALVVDRAGLIAAATLNPVLELPEPSGPADVGTDVVTIVDRARAGRRLMLTRWYPAATHAANLREASYASPALAAALGLPPVRVHALVGARARRGGLPTVVFSPGGGTARILYQAIAEDLASHGYLVVAVDHTGEAPMELPDGRIDVPSGPPAGSIAAVSATRLADMRLVLRRLNTMAAGQRADRRRIAAVGHSLGGSTSAALMRAEPSIRAGVDMDGTVFGTASKRGVPRAFLVMLAGHSADASIRGLLKHSRGPRLALEFAGFGHRSFTDLPIFGAGPEVGKAPSARDIVAQRAYLRAFLDRYVLGRRAPLLDGPSRRFPQVHIAYRVR